ncbi:MULTISPECIES: hypothetical protein [Gordonia]|uniref:hypothetical protein n=1 Tax=Gordonia TaxID=2053 RepID=UPI000815CC35|nr:MULTISPECIES: hypothetical protein [Gordonia]MBA5846878.1 hypothetical protein [Gordonia amicalis]WJG15572.1 hypothetical protein PWF70_11545 [Gordonia sp. Swx-4]SCC59637.1 hypothetical protein GA0061091_13619 [Gordonia sp. v-85]
MPTQERLRKDLLGGALTTALGVFTLGIGVYFLFLRPFLLPEDIRHTGIDAATLPVAFVDWLGIVFSTWGGFIAGFGIVLLGIGATLLSRRTLWLYLGTAAGVLVAFGRFVISNILIGSDFLWFIATMFVLALVLATVLVLNVIRRHRTNETASSDVDGTARAC